MVSVILAQPVPVAKCTKTNEEFQECASECRPKCPEYDADGKVIPPPDTCQASCISGCFCRNGTVLDPKNNNACVESKDCTK